MMKKKYYAVSVGRKTGVFDTWNECSMQVNGVKNSKFKSFSTLNEAESFVAGITISKVEDKYIKETIYCYTDGSCIKNDGTTPSGWGICCVINNISIWESCGRVELIRDSPNFLGAENMTNNTGELSAIGQALKIILNIVMQGDVIIKSDSVYSIKTIQGICKINKNIELINTIQYLLKEVKKTRNVKFEHVKSHSNFKWNERADVLANEGRK